MTALALPALALARQSVEAMPTLFAGLARRSPPAQVVRLDSTGHAREGQGAARYIADAICSEELLAAHPRFVFRTANNRLFRLLPDAASLAVEQGGAQGDGATNDQPAIQAAIDYAEAVGARELRFESASYRIDCPVRTSPDAETRATDGRPLVVRRTLAMRGCAPDRSVLDFRGVGGVDPEANWQTVATSAGDPSPAVWRGGGIFLLGDPPNAVEPYAPATRRIARFQMDRLVLKGNRRNTGAHQWPADPVTGDGWDVSDRALWLQDSFAGDIVCRDVDMIGWKGEIFHLAGEVDAVQSVDLARCRFLTSNGSAFNPAVTARLLVADCEFGDCFIAQEDSGKADAVYRQCLWRNCAHITLGSGPAAEKQYNFFWPTRDPQKTPPRTLLLDCEFRDVDRVFLSSWISGTIRTYDTMVVLDGGLSEALRDVDLKIDAWLDRRSNFHALVFHGVASLTEQVGGAPPGVYKQPPSHVRVKLRHYRTRQARDNNLEWLGFLWLGLIDGSCRIECEGDYGHARTPNGGVEPLSMPYVTFTPGVASTAWTPNGYFYAGDVTGQTTLTPAAPFMVVQVTGEVSVDLTLARYPVGGADYGYANGQKVRLVKQFDNGSIRFVKGAAPVNQAVMATRVLDLANDWIEFAYNRWLGRWEEAGFFSAA